MTFLGLVLVGGVLGGCSAGPQSFPTYGVEAARKVAAGQHDGSLMAFGGEVISATKSGFTLEVGYGSSIEWVHVDTPFRQEVASRGQEAAALGHVKGGWLGQARLDAVAIRGSGQIQWLKKHDAEYEAWKAGTIFSNPAPDTATE